MSVTYAIWALLPLLFSFITARGFYKVHLRKSAHEDYKSLFKQSIYLWITFFVAIQCDQYLFDLVIDILKLREDAANIARFLVYPVVLAVTSAIQSAFDSKKKKGSTTYRRRL